MKLFPRTTLAVAVLLTTTITHAAPVTLTVSPIPSTSAAGNTLGISATVTAQSGTLAPTGTILVQSQIPHERCSVRVGASSGTASTGGCSITLITTATRQFTVQFLGDVGWDDASTVQAVSVAVMPAGLPTVGFMPESSMVVGVPIRLKAPANFVVPPAAPMTLSLGGASCRIVNYLSEPNCWLTPVNTSTQLILDYPGDAHYGAVGGLVVNTVGVLSNPALLTVPSSISVNESQTLLTIPVTAISGTRAFGSFRVRVNGQSAVLGEDLLESDLSIPVTQDSIFVELVPDERIEGNETAQIEIYDIQGARFDRTTIALTIIDNDTVVPQTYVVNTSAAQNDGCAVNGCSFSEAIQAANASLGADRIEFNLPAAGVINVTTALQSTGDLVLDGRSQTGYVASTNLSGAPNGTMGVQLRLSPGTLAFTGRTEIYGIAVDGTTSISLSSPGESLIQGSFIGSDRFGVMNVANSVFLRTGNNVLLGGGLAQQRNIISTGLIGSSDTGLNNPGVRMIGNWVGLGRNATFAQNIVNVTARRLLISNNDFFNKLGLEGFFGEAQSNRWVRGNRFSGPGGLQLLRVQQAVVGGAAQTDANRFFNLTPEVGSLLREGNIRLNTSNADLRGNLMGGNPGRAIVVDDRRLGNAVNDAMLLETLDDPFDVDAFRNADIRQRFQNAPEILSVNRTATHVTLTYRVNSLPGFSRYPLSIEFFQAEDDEGKAILGRDEYSAAEAMTIKSLTLPIPPGLSFAPNDFVLATATDADGTSSTFNRYPLRVRITQDSPDSSTSGQLVTVGAEFSSTGPVAPFGTMLVGLRPLVLNSNPFADTFATYCRSAIANVGGNLASASCSGTDSTTLVSNPSAIFASLGFDVPFALEVDQEAHTIRQASADFSIGAEAAVVSELSLGVDACEARSFIVSVRNNGPDTASATLNVPRPITSVLQDWRYTCTSVAGICGAISTGTTSLTSALTLAANTQLDLRIDFRGVQTPRGTISFGGGIIIQAPATDPNSNNNSFSVPVPLTLFENGFENISPLRLCLTP